MRWYIFLLTQPIILSFNKCFSFREVGSISLIAVLWCLWLFYFDFSVAQQPLCGQGPPHYREFTISLRHTTLVRTPLDEWSARRRDLYLETHNTHKRQTSLPPAGLEPVIPVSERPMESGLVEFTVWFSSEWKFVFQCCSFFSCGELRTALRPIRSATQLADI